MRTSAIPVVCALALLATPLGAAQLYRWVDEKGNVEWRDTPPPASAKKVEQRTVSTSPIPASDLPYSLQQAVKNFPVTLWTTDCGDLCNRARAHLSRRGVPHTEKDPQTDIEAFKKISGGSFEVPFLLVGNVRLKGYLPSAWDSALDTAGYPQTALITIKPQTKAPARKEVIPPVSVWLYTSSACGEPCDRAKELLAGRGIKYQEVPTNTDEMIEALKKMSPNPVVPTLVVGRAVVSGFTASEYHRVLNEAGFEQQRTAAKP